MTCFRQKGAKYFHWHKHCDAHQKWVAAEKAKKALVSMCDHALVKLAPIKQSLQMVLNQPLANQIPAMALDGLEDVYSTEQAVLDEAL